MTKLDYILSLNGKCPEGMEVQKFLVGGCVKCAKKAAAKSLMACGGKAKKRITKAQNGTDVQQKDSLAAERKEHEALIKKYQQNGRKLSEKEMKRLQELNRRKTSRGEDGV